MVSAWRQYCFIVECTQHRIWCVYMVCLVACACSRNMLPHSPHSSGSWQPKAIQAIQNDSDLFDSVLDGELLQSLIAFIDVSISEDIGMSEPEPKQSSELRKHQAESKLMSAMVHVPKPSYPRVCHLIYNHAITNLINPGWFDIQPWQVSLPGSQLFANVTLRSIQKRGDPE